MFQKILQVGSYGGENMGKWKLLGNGEYNSTFDISSISGSASELFLVINTYSNGYSHATLFIPLLALTDVYQEFGFSSNSISGTFDISKSSILLKSFSPNTTNRKYTVYYR